MFITNPYPIFTKNNYTVEILVYFTFYKKLKMMEKTGSIKFLNQEIKKLEKIRSELQERCLHKETSIKIYNYGYYSKTYL